MGKNQLKQTLLCVFPSTTACHGGTNNACSRPSASKSECYMRIVKPILYHYATMPSWTGCADVLTGRMPEPIHPWPCTLGNSLNRNSAVPTPPANRR